MTTSTTDARRNRIDTELRAKISNAAGKSNLSDVKLLPSPNTDRPFMIQTSKHVPAFVFGVLTRHGYRVVGVDHHSDLTHIHVSEA